MDKVQVFTYKFASIIKNLALLVVVFLLLIKLKLIRDMVESQINLRALERQYRLGSLSYLQPFYYFAIITYLCQMLLGGKVVQGKLIVIKDLGI